MGTSVSTEGPNAEGEKNLNLEFNEIQEKLRSVDVSITKLMKSIDIVHGTAKVVDSNLRLQQAVIEESPCLDTMKKNLEFSKQCVLPLLLEVEESLASQQTETIDILSKFLQFAAEKCNFHRSSTTDLLFLNKLHAYRDNKKEEHMQNNTCLTTLKTLKEENELLKKDNKNLRDKEETFLNVETIKRTQIDLLEKENKKLKDINEKYTTQKESNLLYTSDPLKLQNQSLKREMKTQIGDRRHLEQNRENVSPGMEIPRHVDISGKPNYTFPESKAEPKVKKMLNDNTMDQQPQHTDVVKTDYEDVCSSWSENIKDLKKDNDVLRKENASLFEKNKTLEQKFLDYNKEIKKLTLSIKTLETNSEEMQNKIKVAEADAIEKGVKLTQVEQEKQASLKMLQEEKQKLTALTEKERNLEAKIIKLTKLRDKQKTEIKDNNTVQYRLESDLKNLKDKDQIKEDQIKNMNKDIEELRDGYNKLSQTNDDLKRQNMKLSKEIDECKLANNNFQEKNTKLITKIKDQEESYEKLKMELDILKAKQCVRVQLYSSNRSEMMSGVEKELQTILKKNMESDTLKVEFIQCAKQSDIEPDVPVLLLCITASRLGTDVAKVTHGLTITPKMALLIFHHKDIHALPNQASHRVLTGTELNSIGGIFDMAFLAGTGIHNCPMNDNNCDRLVNFLKKESNAKALN